jgi:hypothetical protein
LTLSQQVYPGLRDLFDMQGNARRKALILVGLEMIIMMIIAASLPRLTLQPGMPIPRLENNQVVVVQVESEPIAAISAAKFFVVLISLFLAGTFLFGVYKILRGINWKNLAGYIWRMLVVSLIFCIIIFLILLIPGSESPIAAELPVPTPKPFVTSPLGPVPSVLLWLVGIGLLVSSILVGVWIVLSSSHRTIQIDLVGIEAEKAWQAIKYGQDLKDVIIQCYRQMSLAVEKEQGIKRKGFMTTGEFEKLLEAAGIPHDPIHQLTQLFEAVRYGTWQPNLLDEEKAIQCLEAIMQYSRESKRAN